MNQNTDWNKEYQQHMQQQRREQAQAQAVQQQQCASNIPASKPLSRNQKREIKRAQAQAVQQQRASNIPASKPLSPAQSDGQKKSKSKTQKLHETTQLQRQEINTLTQKLASQKQLQERRIRSQRQEIDALKQKLTYASQTQQQETNQLGHDQLQAQIYSLKQQSTSHKQLHVTIQSKKQEIYALKQELTSQKQLQETVQLQKQQEIDARTQKLTSQKQPQETIRLKKQQEIDALKQELASLKHRYQVAPSAVHIVDGINEYDGINIESEVNEDIPFEEYENIHQSHVHHLEQWNRITAKLETFGKSPNDGNTDDGGLGAADDDDAKTADASDLNNALYAQYMECNALMDEQSKLLKKMVSKEHAMAILENGNKVQHQIATHAALVESTDTEQKRLSSEYEGTKKERIVLLDNIAREVQECNAIIGKENQLLAHVKQNDLSLQALQQQRSRLQAVFSNFSAVGNEYSVFEQKNKKFIDEIQKYFREQWTAFESKWSTKWNVVDIVSWFKYKTKGKDTRVIDWSKIADELKQRNITGKSLQAFNDAFIDLIGIKDFAIATHLMKQVQKLRTRYPLKLEESDASENDADDDHKSEEGKPSTVTAGDGEMNEDVVNID